mmetsp:Transcript_41069/g.39584  ORF Transcript_41069/g.39584 Transcript_41069/m.39584 type:complete len:237 (+) Transcript_41069:504-1214(+)
MTEICQSSFPCISWIDFSNFCEKCNLFDKAIQIATIDRLFIATNVVLEKLEQEDNPDKALCRYEFYEILIRIAAAKFKDTGICPTINESLEKLLHEHVFLYASPESWQEFRDNELWKEDINDTLEANLEPLKQIYNSYFTPRKKFMDLSDAMSFMMKDSDLAIHEHEAVFLFGMSKMTVVLESENSHQYKQMKFVEFLELLGRVAKAKFVNTEMESATLNKKLEYVLDIILRMVDQ